MKAALTSNKDFLSGLLLLSLGGVGFYIALDYPFGSALRMGPGYFPRMLSGTLMAFGAFILIRGLIASERVQGKWGWKPLGFICVGLLVFGYVMEHFGLVPALLAMFVISALGGHEFNLLEVVVLTAVMTAFAIGVFVYLLGLPYPLIQGF